jgi:hypothetical protein
LLLSSRLDLKRAKSAARASLASVPLANRAVKQRRSWGARGADETWGVTRCRQSRRCAPSRRAGEPRWVGLASVSPRGGAAKKSAARGGGRQSFFAERGERPGDTGGGPVRGQGRESRRNCRRSFDSNLLNQLAQRALRQRVRLLAVGEDGRADEELAPANPMATAADPPI